MAGKIITKLLFFPAKESPNMGSKQFTLTLLHFKLVVAKTRDRGRGVFFFQIFCFNFCGYSPVLFFSYVRHLSFIYGGN